MDVALQQVRISSLSWNGDTNRLAPPASGETMTQSSGLKFSRMYRRKDGSAYRLSTSQVSNDYQNMSEGASEGAYLGH